METRFTKLNKDWNAEPNAPYPAAEWCGASLKLRFYMNPFQFKQYNEENIGAITFTECARYRIGTMNDEGWYRGQCRFSKIAPAWGEFYEVVGDLKLDALPDDWNVRVSDTTGLRHYLFYFRDEEFECDAKDWTLKIIRAEPPRPAEPSSAGAPEGR